MNVRDLEHVQVAMPAGEERRAREFYGGVLELPELPKPANLAARGGVWFAVGSRQLHLGVEADFRPARKAHPALLVRDLASLLGRCRQAGVPIVEGEPLTGYARADVADPFGNRIELLQPLAGGQVEPPPADVPPDPGRTAPERNIIPDMRAIEIKAFVPARDFELSKRFYEDVGFTKASDAGGVAYFHLGEASFLLQDFFGEELAGNLTMHLLVEDVDAWRNRIREADISARYGVKVTEVVQQPWRMRDFVLIDPSGVSWRIAQNTD